MKHKRQLIREAIRDLLGKDPVLKGRVTTTRTRPTETAELPVVIIYGLQETSERSTINRTLTRTLTIAIEIRASSAGALDDTLDGLCRTVERTMASNPVLSGLAIDSGLGGTDIGLDGDGEARQALATLRYAVLYQTDASGN